MWIAIIGCLLAAFAAGLLFISFRAAEFGFVRRLTGGRKGAARLICLAVFAVLTAALWLAWNMMNAVVCMVHLVVFWLLCDGIVRLAARLHHSTPRREAAGIAAAWGLSQGISANEIQWDRIPEGKRSYVSSQSAR